MAELARVGGRGADVLVVGVIAAVPGVGTVRAVGGRVAVAGGAPGAGRVPGGSARPDRPAVVHRLELRESDTRPRPSRFRGSSSCTCPPARRDRRCSSRSSSVASKEGLGFGAGRNARPFSLSRLEGKAAADVVAFLAVVAGVTRGEVHGERAVSAGWCAVGAHGVVAEVVLRPARLRPWGARCRPDPCCGSAADAALAPASPRGVSPHPAAISAANAMDRATDAPRRMRAPSMFFSLPRDRRTRKGATVHSSRTAGIEVSPGHPTFGYTTTGALRSRPGRVPGDTVRKKRAQGLPEPQSGPIPAPLDDPGLPCARSSLGLLEPTEAAARRRPAPASAAWKPGSGSSCWRPRLPGGGTCPSGTRP